MNESFRIEELNTQVKSLEEQKESWCFVNAGQSIKIKALEKVATELQTDLIKKNLVLQGIPQANRRIWDRIIRTAKKIRPDGIIDIDSLIHIIQNDHLDPRKEDMP